MRILFGVIISALGILLGCQPVLATGIAIDELTIRAACQDDGELSATYELRTILDNEWFRLQTTARIYGSGANYYAIDNYCGFEKYLKHLQVDCGASDSVDYGFINFGAGYQRKLFGNWGMGIDWEVESRAPKGTKGSFYRDDTVQIELKYQSNPFQYCVLFNREGKDYPVSTIYTSLKYSVENTLSWNPSPKLGFQATYQEDSGAYPARSAQNYWKTKWSIGGHWCPSQIWRFDLGYKAQDWDKGFFPYRRDHWLQSEAHYKVGMFSEWSLAASVHGMAYCDTDALLLDPGEWVTDETKSRQDAKLNLEYCRRQGIFRWTLGYFIERADYQSEAVTDKQDEAYYTSLGWNFKKISLDLSLTPGGSVGNRYSRYQLILGYHPD